MVYLDTSVLLVYTLTHSSEVQRSGAVDKLFTKINARLVLAATSFYALHELYVFALENTPDPEIGSNFGKAALKNYFAPGCEFHLLLPAQRGGVLPENLSH